MTTQTRQINTWVAVTVFIAIATFAGCKREADEKNDIDRYRHEITPSESVPDKQSEFAKPDTELKTGTKISISDVIRSAKTWRPAYVSWYGKAASVFLFPDIYGQQQGLSASPGKNVIITFWATWCPGCKEQMRDLIALRNLISDDKLTILTISFLTRWPPNTPEVVKNFVEQNKINYPVISVGSNVLPAPYGQVTSIPCSFFIDSEGKIKLATEGLIPLSDMKAILEAEY